MIKANPFSCRCNMIFKMPLKSAIIPSVKSIICFTDTTCPLPLLQVFTRYGKCYMFNAAEEGKTLRTTVKGGTGNGLEVMLDIQQDEYLPVWGETGMAKNKEHTPDCLNRTCYD